MTQQPLVFDRVLTFLLTTPSHLARVGREQAAYTFIMAALTRCVRNGSAHKSHEARGVHTYCSYLDSPTTTTLVVYGGPRRPQAFIFDEFVAAWLYHQLLGAIASAPSAIPMPAFLERAMAATARFGYTVATHLWNAAVQHEQRASVYAELVLDAPLLTNENRLPSYIYIPGSETPFTLFDSVHTTTRTTLPVQCPVAHFGNDRFVRALLVTRYLCEYLAVADVWQTDKPPEPEPFDRTRVRKIAYRAPYNDGRPVPTRFTADAKLDTSGEPQRLFERVLEHALALRTNTPVVGPVAPRIVLGAHVYNTVRREVVGKVSEFLTDVRRAAAIWGTGAPGDAADAAVALVFVALLARVPEHLRRYHVASKYKDWHRTRAVPASVVPGSATALDAAARYGLVSQERAARALLVEHTDVVSVCVSALANALDLLASIQRVAPHAADGRDFVVIWSDTAPTDAVVLMPRTLLDVLPFADVPPAFVLNAYRDGRRTWRAAWLALATMRRMLGFDEVDAITDEAELRDVLARLDRVLLMFGSATATSAFEPLRFLTTLYKIMVGEAPFLLNLLETLLTPHAPTVALMTQADETLDAPPVFLRASPLLPVWTAMCERPDVDASEARRALAAAIARHRGAGSVYDEDDDDEEPPPPPPPPSAPVPRPVYDDGWPDEEEVSVDSDDDGDDHDDAAPVSAPQRVQPRAAYGVYGQPFYGNHIQADARNAIVHIAPRDVVIKHGHRLHWSLVDEILQRSPTPLVHAGRVRVSARRSTVYVFRAPAILRVPVKTRPNAPAAAPPADAAATEFPAMAARPTESFVRAWAAMATVVASTAATDARERAAVDAALVELRRPLAASTTRLTLTRSRLLARASPTTLIESPLGLSPLLFGRTGAIEAALLNFYFTIKQ